MQAFTSWIKTVQSGAEHDFEAFLKRRQEIASAYVRGDGAPLAAIVTELDPATFYGPSGAWETGAKAVAESYARGAKTFGESSSTRLEILQSGASGKLAFWTGLQHASVADEKDRKTEMILRVTEVFRLEDGDFKLVHRHADPAKR
jgi:ketosteroid isomerase-like protein